MALDQSNQMLYVGGIFNNNYNNDKTLRKVAVYDIAQNTWQDLSGGLSLPPVSSGTLSCSNMAYYNNRLYLSGNFTNNYDNTLQLSNVTSWDTVNRKWIDLSNGLTSQQLSDANTTIFGDNHITYGNGWANDFITLDTVNKLVYFRYIFNDYAVWNIMNNSWNTLILNPLAIPRINQICVCNNRVFYQPIAPGINYGLVDSSFQCLTNSPLAQFYQNNGMFYMNGNYYTWATINTRSRISLMDFSKIVVLQDTNTNYRVSYSMFLEKCSYYFNANLTQTSYTNPEEPIATSSLNTYYPVLGPLNY